MKIILIVGLMISGLVAFSVSALALECAAEDIQIRWGNSNIWEQPISQSVSIENGAVGEHMPYATPGIHTWEAKTPELEVRKIVAVIDMQNMPVGMFSYSFRCRVRSAALIGPWSESSELILISVPGKPARVIAE